MLCMYHHCMHWDHCYVCIITVCIGIIVMYVSSLYALGSLLCMSLYAKFYSVVLNSTEHKHPSF